MSRSLSPDSKNDSKKEEYEESESLRKIYDPNNYELPEPNFEEFEKVSDLNSVKQRPTIYNQMSLDSMSPLNLKKNNDQQDNNKFKIKIMPMDESTNSINSSEIENNKENEDDTVLNSNERLISQSQNYGSNIKKMEDSSEEDYEDDSIEIIEEDDEENKEEIDSADDLKENDEEKPSELKLPEKEEDDNAEKQENEIKELLKFDEENLNNANIEEMLDMADEKANGGEYHKLRTNKQYKNRQLLIYPDDHFKNIWEIAVSILLAYTCLVLPYRVAFSIYPSDEEIFNNIDWFVDSAFMLDIIINFMSAYYDTNENLIVSYRKIFKNYIKGWLIVDILGVFPFDKALETDKYSNLVRLVRLPRLLKFIKMTKLLRILKLLKEKNRIIHYLMEFLAIGGGFERLFLSMLSILFLCHIGSCIWFMVADLNEGDSNWVHQYEFTNKSNFEIYVSSFYWITQTVVTVGYGDISAQNSVERLVACIIMLLGVFFYSFTIGSLSSLLSSLDSKNASYDQKLNTLIQIRNQYNIDTLLYNRVKRALKFGTTQNDNQKIQFLNDLPLNLRIELSIIMHKNLVSGIEFFRNKQPQFLALIGPFLKPIHIGKDEYIFHEGEYADEMYFLKKGSVSIVLKQFNNFEFIRLEKGYYFGEVDLLFGETRKYTYMAITDLELLVLNKKDFTKIFFNEFRDIGSELYKNAIKRRIRYAKYYKEALEYCQKNFDTKSKSKSSFYGFRTQVSMANKQSSSFKESEIFAFKNSDKEHKNKINIENENENENEENNILIEKKEKNMETDINLEKKESNNNDLNVQSVKEKGLKKFSGLMAKSQFTKNTLLSALEEEDKDKKNDVIGEGLEKIDQMQKKMKNIENNMEEIFEMYRTLGLNSDRKKNKEEKEGGDSIDNAPLVTNTNIKKLKNFDKKQKGMFKSFNINKKNEEE